MSQKNVELRREGRDGVRLVTPWSFTIAIVMTIVVAGCGGDGERATTSVEKAALGNTAERTAKVPAPRRNVAPSIPLTPCGRLPHGGGHDVKAAGISCRDVGKILVAFTTAFSIENLHKELVSRGHGWRCFQRLYERGFSVQEVCWRSAGQVLIFSK